jgi:hypothetical protein
MYLGKCLMEKIGKLCVMILANYYRRICGTASEVKLSPF